MESQAHDNQNHIYLLIISESFRQRTSSKQRKHILSEFRLRELRLQEIERESFFFFISLGSTIRNYLNQVIIII
ncbi:unnamed protein product, partial [Brassica rapa subsp. trilocularis]